MKIDKNLNTFVIAAVLIFIAAAVSVICITYVNLLFLSSYPKSLLPYLYISQATAAAMMAFFCGSFLAKKSNLYLALIEGSLAIPLILFIFLIRLNLVWVPFGFCVWLLCIQLLIGVLIWNTITSAFNVRKFKNIVRWISISASCGAAICGLLAAKLLDIFSTEILIYILAVLLLLIGFLTFKLKRVPLPRKLSQHKQSPFSYSIYKRLLFCIVITAFIYSIIDFGLKSELAANYTKSQIGEFMSLFLGVCSVVTLIVQLLGLKKVTERYAVVGLLSILPAFWVLTAIGVLVNPGIVTITILAAGWVIFNYSFSNSGQQFVLNILPDKARQVGKFYSNGVGRPLGIGIAAICLWFVHDFINLYEIAAVVIVVALFLLYMIRPLKKGYKETLQQELALMRFDADFISNNHVSRETVQNMALRAIQSKDIKQRRFGFLLWQQFPPKMIPPQALRLFARKDPELKIELLQLIQQIRDPQAADMVARYLKKEENVQVKGSLLKTLAAINPKLVLKYAKKMLQSSEPELLAGAVLIALSSGDLDEVRDAILKFEQMINSSDAIMRLEAAKIIGLVKVGDLYPYISKLISDQSEIVSINAIRAVSLVAKDLRLVPLLIEKLKNGFVAYYAAKALVSYGKDVIPNILEALEELDVGLVRNATSVLVLLQCYESEQALLDIYLKSDVMIRDSIAKKLAFRAIRLEPSKQLKKYAKQYAFKELDNIQLLRFLKLKTAEIITREIDSRIEMARKRYLYWFAVGTDTYGVFQVLPTLFKKETSEGLETHVASVFELLDAFADDRELSNSLKLLEEEGSHDISNANVASYMKQYPDSWLKRVFDYKKLQYTDIGETKMDDMQKVFILRFTKMFADLPGETLLAVAKETETINVKAKDIIFTEGDKPNGLYIVVSGTISLSKEGKIAKELQTGDFFGELALLDDAKRTASAAAKTDGVLLYLDRDIFESIISDIPAVLKAVTNVVVGYLREQLQKS